MQTVNWKNPYEIKGNMQLRGNLHTHTSPASGCGRIPLPEVIKKYEELKFDFLSITDHMGYTDTSSINTNMILLPGVEWNSEKGDHTCMVNLDSTKLDFDDTISQQQLIDNNIEKGSIVTLNHPDWQLTDHYSLEKLAALDNYSGIEIYNSVIERLAGSPLATLKWDRLLSSGKRILGFSNQDSHQLRDFNLLANVVFTSGRSAGEIIEALKTGSFYCDYGVTINDIGRKENTLFVETKNADVIRFVGTSGVILNKVSSASAEMEFLDEETCTYVRIECLGNGEAISWSQPFFRE